MFNAIFFFAVCFPLDALWDIPGCFNVTGPKATAGIFATYPGKHLSIVNGFFDQVRFLNVETSIIHKILSWQIPCNSNIQLTIFFLFLSNTDYWHSSTHCLYSGYCGSIQQPHPSRSGGLHCGICGSGHWTVYGLQLWLCCQPCQRPRATYFHLYGWLGHRGFHVSAQT